MMFKKFNTIFLRSDTWNGELCINSPEFNTRRMAGATVPTAHNCRDTRCNFGLPASIRTGIHENVWNNDGLKAF